MFTDLELLPEDAILGLAAACREDPNPSKVDLSVGIYMDEDGVCPVFAAIKEAQKRLVDEEVSKAYLPAAGVKEFTQGIEDLLFGQDADRVDAERVSSIQAPGGCGALKILAEVIRAAAPQATVWVSDPSWPNHTPLLGGSGLKFQKYRYYDATAHGVDFDGMMADLSNATAGDIVLLHGCCHNPCGADLSPEQWLETAALAQTRGLVPLIDIAYQGLGSGLDADAYGVRALVKALPEVMIASSCSKNMGLYRERTGCAVFVCQDQNGAKATLSQAKVAARRVYSMPPAHGGLLAGRVLSDDSLRAMWEQELSLMCERINGVREQLVTKLEAATGRDFGFIRHENGMFSFLGLSTDQVSRLRDEFSVYMVGSSRINVAGVNSRNIDYLADSVAAVL